MSVLMEANITHSKESDVQTALDELKHVIVSRGDLSHASIEAQVRVLEELAAFPLGQFILLHRSANGFWTDYMINYKGHELANSVEEFILTKSPVVLAHRERFTIFQRILQENLKEGVRLASVPCGLMRDLLGLDYSALSSYKLIGIDIDEEALQEAQKLASRLNIENVEFFQQDAWSTDCQEELDIITSNGLNVYESDRNRVIDLYKNFHSGLKPGGLLVVGVLTYPPGASEQTDWNMDLIPQDDLEMESLLHHDILDVKWGNFRHMDEIKKDFLDAGFSEVSVYLDLTGDIPYSCC